MTTTTITTTSRRLRPTFLLAFGLLACTPNPGEGTPGKTSGTGGVNAERTGGTTGAVGSTSGGGNGNGSGGSVGSGSGGAGPSNSGGAGVSSGGSAGSAANSGGAAGSKSGGSSGTSDAMSSMEAPPSGGGSSNWEMCGGTSFKPGVSAADFCAKYESACTFSPGAGKTRYASMADCIAKYSALSDGDLGGKACVAWHLCIAATPSTAETFCPHAPEASAMSGPCKAAYLY